jgi:hypothetical protein
METIHKYSFSKNEKDLEKLFTKNNIKVKRNRYIGGKEDEYSIEIAINESDAGWSLVDQKAEEFEALNMYVTIFSEDEKKKAEWLVARPDKESGRLEPRDEREKQKEWICLDCGTYQQTKPFRITDTKLPRGADVFTLVPMNVLLVSADVEKEIQKHDFRGYEIMDVILNKTVKPAKDFRQLFIPKVVESGMIGWEHLRQPPCKTCRTVKYLTKQKGMMKYRRSALPKGVDFFLGNEWWGSGWVAFHQIVVSNRVARLFLEKGWKGVDFQPVELVEG